MMKSKRRILVFSTAYFPFVGGAEVSIREIAKRLTTDFDFELITARLNRSLEKEEVIDNILVHRVGFGSMYDKMLLPILGTIKALKIIREREVDIFWAVMVSFASGVPYIVNMLRRIKIPIVLMLEEGDSEEYISKKTFGFLGFLWKILMSPILFLEWVGGGMREWKGLIGISWRLALARSDRVVAISSYLKKRAEYYGCKGKVDVIPIGVDFSFFSKKVSEEEKEKLIKKFRKKKNEKYIITASRLVEKNGVEDLIHSISLLPKNIKLIIAGDGELADVLWELAVNLGVEKRVKFVGRYTHEDLRNYFSISDVFVRASHSEGLGIVFLEAMANGLPVVATAVGGIVDFIFDPKFSGNGQLGKITPTGLFCNVADPESIKEKVLVLLKNDRLRNKIIKNGKELVREKYDWWKIRDELASKVFSKL